MDKKQEVDLDQLMEKVFERVVKHVKPVNCNLHESWIQKIDCSIEELASSLCSIKQNYQQIVQMKTLIESLNKKMFYSNGEKSIVSRIDSTEEKIGQLQEELTNIRKERKEMLGNWKYVVGIGLSLLIGLVGLAGTLNTEKIDNTKIEKLEKTLEAIQRTLK